MRRSLRCAALLAVCVLGAAPSWAQTREPRIGPFVLDLRAVLPKFPSSPQLAASHGLTEADLPGVGIGLDGGVHVYVFTWRVVTFGLGAEFLGARAHHVAPPADTAATAAAVTERFVSWAPQISFNFGTGRGWSYISGGLGRTQWSVIPDGEAPGPADVAWLRTFDYGGGARWFIKAHLAFAFDVRFYAVDPGAPQGGLPGSPRATQLVAGAGISLK
jgi:hypothetical protein